MSNKEVTENEGCVLCAKVHRRHLPDRRGRELPAMEIVCCGKEHQYQLTHWIGDMWCVCPYFRVSNVVCFVTSPWSERRVGCVCVEKEITGRREYWIWSEEISWMVFWKRNFFGSATAKQIDETESILTGNRCLFGKSNFFFKRSLSLINASKLFNYFYLTKLTVLQIKLISNTVKLDRCKNGQS